MSALDFLLLPGADIYYNDSFRNTIESLRSWLKNHSETRSYEVPLATGQLHDGDFNGLIISLGLPLKYAWIYMRTTGLECATDYDYRVHRTLILPSEKEIERIRNTHNVQSTLKS